MPGRVQPPPPTKGKKKRPRLVPQCGRGKGSFREMPQHPAPAALPPQRSVHTHGLFESNNNAKVNFAQDAQKLGLISGLHKTRGPSGILLYVQV